MLLSNHCLVSTIMYKEEFEAVKSLFCHPGECKIQDNVLTINTQAETNDPENHVPVEIVFQIPEDYPASFPQISMTSKLFNRDVIKRIRDKSLDDCRSYLGEPLLMNLISTIQEYFREELESNSKDFDVVNVDNEVQSGKICTSVLHIDHMRSPNKYCKTLEKWASKLSLCGAIVFLNKLILLILQGDTDNVKDFIVRLKTVNVDVDSKGHSCKERMMTVLFEKLCHMSEIDRFNGFSRRHLESREQLQMLFSHAGLDELYHEHVTRLLSRS